MVGAVQSVDALSIYAREGVDLGTLCLSSYTNTNTNTTPPPHAATKWTGPAKGTVAEYALLQFLHDYDGQGSSVAGASYVNVTTASDMLGAHGFLSANGRTFHCVLICKQYEGSMAVTVALPTKFGTASVDLYRLDAHHLARDSPEALSVSGGSAVVTVAPMSATMLVAVLK